jgi:signal transduction histidine kinase
MAGFVREAVVQNGGGRVYAVVNYEGTEIAPEIVQYYGERIKGLQDRYAMTTVRYSSSGLTRSMLRYLGAAFDLESNIFTTRAEAIRAIQELERRSPAQTVGPTWANLDPRRSIFGKLLLGWLAGFIVLLLAYGVMLLQLTDQAQLRPLQLFGTLAVAAMLLGALASAFVLRTAVIRPLRQMDALARGLVVGSAFEPVSVTSNDEVGHLARMLNEAARQLRRDIERLSGLYHISLMMGTGTQVSTICELLTRKIARLLGADMCVILLADEKEKFIYAQLPAYGVSDKDAESLRSDLDHRNIATCVYQTGEPYLSNDIVADSLISKSAAELLGVRAILAVPLQAGEQTLGTLEVMNKAGGFIEDDKRLVTIFASQAAHLIVNAQLFEQLIISKQLAVVGELVAGVAHEVRNPLCGITTTLSAMSRRLKDRADVQPFMDVIMTEADHLNRLMEELLEHSCPSRPDNHPADIRDVVREVIGEWRSQAEAKGVALRFEHPDTLPGLRLDRRKMHGVFANLLNNALHHTEPGGHVQITVSAPPAQPPKRNGQKEIQVEISDDGTGIAPANLSKIFEPFFTTRTTGTGLGLAIVRKTVHDHGGVINARSAQGKGTTFTISLPVKGKDEG